MYKIRKLGLVEEKDRACLNYASVPLNNNLKLRLYTKFSYICCIFLHKASTSDTEAYSKMVHTYFTCYPIELILHYHYDSHITNTVHAREIL